MMTLLLLLLAFVVACWCLYLFRRRLLARLLKLPPAQYAVSVARAIPVPMADGVRLLTDHYWPKGEGEFPTILIRTPYGRGKEVFLLGGYPMAEMPGQRFAERGYHVIVQTVRGCYDSGGEFEPHVNEAADGQATVDWISDQPWFDGRLAAWGPSYLGYTLWATATTTKTKLRAIVPVITSAENFGVTHPDEAFGLETRLRWSQGLARARQLHGQSFIGKIRGRFFGKDEEALQAAFGHVPLSEADLAAVGHPLPFYRQMLANDSWQDPYWLARDHSGPVSQVEAPAHLIGGWYDYYLRGLLRDYGALRAAGRDPYLTIGPWYHASAGSLVTGLREGLKWFDLQLKGLTDNTARRPVRLFVMGADEWREMAAFPPPSSPLHYYLHDGQALLTTAPESNSPPDNYVYDPADPTPALGGALLAFKGAGPLDNRPLASREDVLCYTSEALQDAVEFIGLVKLTLYVRSSLSFTDFFGRLCDLFPDGQSINICDGLYRIKPGQGQRQPDGTLRITIDMWSTAYRLLPGHRLQLLVSSGAHPRWNRNSGTGDADAGAVEMIDAEQSVYHDADHPSALVLPFIADV